MTTGTIHFGGVPTDIEVRRLREAYPEQQMQAGQVIPYAEVERLIECRKGTSRWAAVTSRWRKIVEREADGVIIGTVAGKGFKVLEASDKLDLSERKVATALRSTRRSVKIAGAIKPRELSEDERDRLMHQQRRAAAILGSAQIRKPDNLPALDVEKESNG